MLCLSYLLWNGYPQVVSRSLHRYHNNQGVTTYISKRFFTFTGDLRRCAVRPAEHDCEDVFGKVASAITTYLLDKPTTKITYVSDFRTKGMKATDEEIFVAIDGELYVEQAEKLQIICSHMDKPQSLQSQSGSLILSMAEKYLPQLNLVMTVPGIQSFLPQLASSLKSELICPCSREQRKRGKKKTTRIGRSGIYIKHLLVYCSLGATRKKRNPEISRHYENLKKRLVHKKAIIAIERKLLTATYNILKKNETYNLELYAHINTPTKQWNVSVKDAIFILQRQGQQVWKENRNDKFAYFTNNYSA